MVLMVALAGCRSESSLTPEPTSTNLEPIPPTETPEPALPRFEPAECAFSPHTISYVDCGYLIVPEDRDRLDGPTIRLHVAVVHTLSRNPEPDPLIYLSGGPGSFSLEWLYGNIPYFSAIRKKRDVIFFDPRGVGYSEPSLDCPEIMEAFHESRDQPLNDEAWVNLQVEASLACRDRLMDEGIDLGAYHSAAMAADVNDLRMVLGYDQVNLMGISYGTRIAQTVMRDFPDMLRSVVLDSAVPVELDLPYTAGISVEEGLEVIFQRCAADALCNEKYPDLPRVLDELTEKISENPITIKVLHLVKNESYDIQVNRRVLGWALAESLYNYETAIYLPKLIYETYLGENGNYQTLATSLEIYLLSGDYSSEGHQYSVLCSDEWSFASIEPVWDNNANLQAAIADFYNSEAEITYRVCEEWGAKTADPIENEPVVSDVPTLILAGEYDPATPPWYGRLVAEKLQNAQVVEFPGLGHSVFAERGCAREIVADFIDDPDILVDDKCTEMIRFNLITY